MFARPGREAGQLESVGNDLRKAVQQLQPTALIGAAAARGAFSREVLSQLSQVSPDQSLPHHEIRKYHQDTSKVHARKVLQNFKACHAIYSWLLMPCPADVCVVVRCQASLSLKGSLTTVMIEPGFCQKSRWPCGVSSSCGWLNLAWQSAGQLQSEGGFSSGQGQNNLWMF